jgi:hypothetical protein
MSDPKPDQRVGEVQPQAEDYVTAAGALLATDAIEKIDAGAALIHALYHLPAAKITALLDGASPGFCNTYTRAQAAYAVGRRS